MQTIHCGDPPMETNIFQHIMCSICQRRSTPNGLDALLRFCAASVKGKDLTKAQRVHRLDKPHWKPPSEDSGSVDLKVHICYI